MHIQHAYKYHLYIIALTTLCLISFVFQKYHPQLCLIQRCHQSNIFQVSVSTNDQYINTFQFPSICPVLFGLSSQNYLTDSRQRIFLLSAHNYLTDSRQRIFHLSSYSYLTDSRQCIFHLSSYLTDSRQHVFLLFSYSYLTDSRQRIFHLSSYNYLTDSRQCLFTLPSYNYHCTIVGNVCLLVFIQLSVQGQTTLLSNYIIIMESTLRSCT